MTSRSVDPIIALQSDAARAVANGDAAKALELYRSASRLEPKNPMHALRAGDCLVRLGRANEALPVYRRVAERYASEGHHARAVSVYRIVQRLFPRDPVAARRLIELKHLRAEQRSSAVWREPTAAEVVEMFPVVLDLDVMEVTPSEHSTFHVPRAAPPQLPASLWNAAAPAPNADVAALEQTVRDLLAELLRTQCELDALRAQTANAVNVAVLVDEEEAAAQA